MSGAKPNATDLDSAAIGIIWSRLVGVVEEANSTLRRCAFSNIVSESNDCTCVLFNSKGIELAEPQATPPTTFLGTMPRTLRLVLDKVKAWSTGDVVICNDPWTGSGHLFDICMVVPILLDGRLIAFSATVAHSPDVGGSVGLADVTDIFQEGLRIPITWLYRAGEIQQSVVDFIQANVRKPAEILGDLHAQLAANRLVEARVKEIVADAESLDLSTFGRRLDAICEQSMRDAIARQIPIGSFTSEMRPGSTAENLVLRVTITRDESTGLAVDFSGTSPQVRSFINVPIPYTLARTNYALKCILLPDAPGHASTFIPFRISAPAGSILNAQFPCAVSGRSTIGHYIPGLVMGALANVIPDRVMAEGAGPTWALVISGRHDNGQSFVVFTLLSGGQGASSTGAGMDVINFPANAANTPVEALEQITTFRVESKQRIRGSGGKGLHRGGDGQRVVLRAAGAHDVTISGWIDRLQYPARGLAGGDSGAVGRIMRNDTAVDPRSVIVLKKGDLLILETPGGGGYGTPRVDQDMLTA